MAENRSSTDCPVAALADEIQHLIRLTHAIDAARISRPSECAELGRMEQAVTARLNAAIDWCSHLRAQGAKGAVMQTIAIADLAIALLGCAAPSESADADRIEKAIRRLTYSVVDFLEAEHGVALEGARRFYLSRGNNPFRRIETAGELIADMAQEAA